MRIVSTLGFTPDTPVGKIPASTFLVTPNVAADGTVTGLPEPQEGVLFLVNARVFGASDRTDLVQFDNAKTARKEDGTAGVQVAFLRKDGTSHPFAAGMF